MQSMQTLADYSAGLREADLRAMKAAAFKETVEDYHQQPLLPSSSQQFTVSHLHFSPNPPSLPFSSLRNVSTLPPISDEADLTEQESSASGSSQDAEGTIDSDLSEGNVTETEDEEDVSPALGRTFSSHAAFERYAVCMLQGSHENAVVERKRHKHSSTINCRNRRGTDAKVPGTNCTWVMKANQVSESKWEIKEICLKHNEACWRIMENIDDDDEEPTPAVAEMQDQKKKASPPRMAYKKRILPAESDDENVVDAVAKEADKDEEDYDGEDDSEPETPWELRKRKANHPGNQLPSRARRYKF